MMMPYQKKILFLARRAGVAERSDHGVHGQNVNRTVHKHALRARPAPMPMTAVLLIINRPLLKRTVKHASTPHLNRTMIRMNMPALLPEEVPR